MTEYPMIDRSAGGSKTQPATIFVINLDVDRDRLEAMESQLAALGWSYRRFGAYRGHALPGWLRAQFLDADGVPLSALKPGEIGCYASHLGVYQTIVEEGLSGPVLILEDDAVISEEFKLVIANLDRLPDDWGIVRCSSTPKAAFVPVGMMTPRIEVARYWRIPMNTTAYLITRTAAASLLGSFQPRSRPLDEDLRRFWEVDLKTYGLIPPPIRARSGKSSIDRLGERKSKNRAAGPSEPAWRARLLLARLRIFGPWLSIRCAGARVVMRVMRLFGGERWPVSVLRVRTRN